jgi:hypothetical protein
MLTSRRHGAAQREHGQVIVLFALLIPVIFAIGSIVMSAGNWYVLKRHLQTQVDAAALAGGASFTGCTFPELQASTNLQIRNDALKFAGDLLRDPATANLQLQESGDVRIVVNSSSYWTQGTATDGTGYDWTIASPGFPCDTKYVDVKATDDRAPLLWKWIPLFPSPKARARVEIDKVRAVSKGVLPVGVPEVDPEKVGVIFVNEDGNPNLASSVRGGDWLNDPNVPNPPAPAGTAGMSLWWKDGIAPVGINGNDNFGVVIIATRDPNASLTAGNGSLHDICNQNTVQTHCYAGDTLTSGISFIHAYSTNINGGPTAPAIRDVQLGGGCTDPDDASRPYFNLNGGCPIGISVVLDFGTGTTNPALPVSSGGVCAEVSVSPGGNLTYSGGIWTGGVMTPLAESGPNQVNLHWETDTNGGCNGNNNGQGNITKIAKPYVADDASGPVQFLTVEKSNGGLANSMEKDSAASLDVVVGLFPPLRDTPLSNPPIPLRFGSGPSQTHALDCGSGAGPNGWRGKMVTGCDAYQVNERNGSCATPYPVPPDCIDSQNGNFNNKGVEDAFASPCTPNNWDGVTLPPLSDKRWVGMFILDEVAFTQPGKKTYPVRRFGGFYVTAGDGMGCPGDDPPSGVKRTELWGHFVTYITPRFDAEPSDEVCVFGEGDLCAPFLVE